MTVSSDFSRWFRRQLSRHEMSQADFARKLGASTGQVSMWASGERHPSPKSIERIADVLFADRDEVLAIAGHRDPDLDLDALDLFHRIADPYAKRIDWEDEENVFDITHELRRMISRQEIRAGRRRRGEYLDPVDEEDE